VSQGERFGHGASIERAKQELREWDATISGRINPLRPARAGEGQSLSHGRRTLSLVSGTCGSCGSTRKIQSIEDWDHRVEDLQTA
jgi:hypothetical protein